MKIYIGADHTGFEIKEKLKIYLKELGLGYEVVDKGASKYDENDDYPDFIFPVAYAVAENSDSRGIIFGMSGQGEAMAANRVHGVRAAVFYGGSEEIIKLSRADNDANVLSLGAKFLSESEAAAAVRLWLATPFPNEERHARRITKLDADR